MSGLLEISIKDRVPGHQDTNGWWGPRTWNGNQWPINGWVPGSQLLGPGKQMPGRTSMAGSSYKAGSQEIKGSAWLGPRKSWLRSGNPERNV